MNLSTTLKPLIDESKTFILPIYSQYLNLTVMNILQLREFCDQADTALVFIMGLGGGEEKLVFNSLTTMIIAIAQSYEAGVYKYDPDRHDMDWEDMEKSRQIRLKYNIGTTNKLFSVDGG